jgi:hypothetical protein
MMTSLLPYLGGHHRPRPAGRGRRRSNWRLSIPGRASAMATRVSGRANKGTGSGGGTRKHRQRNKNLVITRNMQLVVLSNVPLKVQWQEDACSFNQSSNNTEPIIRCNCDHKCVQTIRYNRATLPHTYSNNPLRPHISDDEAPFLVCMSCPHGELLLMLRLPHLQTGMMMFTFCPFHLVLLCFPVIVKMKLLSSTL